MRAKAVADIDDGCADDDNDDDALAALLLDVRLQALHVNLTNRHCHAFASAIDALQRAVRRQPFRRWRPTGRQNRGVCLTLPESIHRRARQWWQFAIRAVAQPFRDRRERRSWLFLQRFSSARRACKTHVWSLFCNLFDLRADAPLWQKIATVSFDALDGNSLVVCCSYICL